MSDGDLFSPALTNFSPASLPRQLWFWYIEYLCRPAPGSWVSSVASTLRILAVVLIAPFVLLTLLDVTSYVIARTLGVVDSTKASTSDKHAPHTPGAADSVALHTPATASGDADGTRKGHRQGPQGRLKLDVQDVLHQPLYDSPPSFFFSPSEEKLSGAGLFSPVASRPASPPVERRPRHQKGDSSAPSTSTSSPSDAESFIMMERDVNVREANAILRRRGGVTAEEPLQS